MEFLPKKIMVPKLKKGYVQTDMGRVQTVVLGKLVKDTVQVLDIVDVLQTPRSSC